MKVFISHSSKDKEIAAALAELITDAAPGTRVFCSSQAGTIRVGDDFVRSVTDAMDQCDAFIPLISPYYYASKFCMIELGFAYSVLVRDYPAGNSYIFPAVVPPVKVNEALMDTPLAHLQASAIHDPVLLRDFLETVLENAELVGRAALKQRIAEFVYNIKTILYRQQDLTADARLLVCKGGVPGDDGDYLSYSVLPDDQGYTVNFRAKPFGGGKYPDFLSFVFQYKSTLDLYDRAVLFADACLTADICSFTDSLRSIRVEVKYNGSRDILAAQTFALRAGMNRISIPLRTMLYEPLKQITEICFVIPGDAYIEDEGMFQIRGLRISRGE